MASRTQKHAAHARKKQHKAADRLKKEKKLALRSKLKTVGREERSKLSDQPGCGLCGAMTNLTKTECCDQWICDDEDQYRLFSFARNSCHRNHRCYTLCGHHFAEQHTGRWHDCPKCREGIEPEMYAHYGTNEYNFEVLENPPAYEPTHCTSCGKVIVMADGGYSYSASGYLCHSCTIAKHPDLYD